MARLLTMALVGSASMIVAGCWWPERFVATIEINQDKSYLVRYEGIVAFIPAAEAIAKGGGWTITRTGA